MKDYKETRSSIFAARDLIDLVTKSSFLVYVKLEFPLSLSSKAGNCGFQKRRVGILF